MSIRPGGGITGWMSRQQQSDGRSYMDVQRDNYGPRLGEDEDDVGACVRDGYALGATDDFEALEGGREYRRRVRRGENAGSAAQSVRGRFAARAAAWAQQNGWSPPGGGGGGRGRLQLRSPFYRVGEDDDLDTVGGDDADEEELGAIDSEINELEGDDDEVEGDDELGGLTGMNRRIARLKALQEKLEARYQATPAKRINKRRALLARIERIKKRLDRKSARFEKKAQKVAAKLGVPVAMLVAGTAGAAAAGISAGAIARAEGDVNRGEMMAAEGFNSFWGPRHAPNAMEVTLPFLVAGNAAPAGYISKPIGAAGGAGSLSMATPSISYADFELVGIDFQGVVTMATAADVPPIITVSTWGISGGFNQVYAEQAITHAGGQMSLAGTGMLNYSKTLPALRQDKLELGRTNTAQLAVNFYCLKANAGVIDVVITASLKLRTKRDDNLARWRS